MPLEPIPIVRQAAFGSPLNSPVREVHSRTNSKTSNFYNYNLEIGWHTTYHIFCAFTSSGKTTAVATISDRRFTSLHPLHVSETRLCLALHLRCYVAAGGLKMIWARNVLDAMYFNPLKRNRWLVVDRVCNRYLGGVFQSEPYFVFHCINAWEERSGKHPDAVDIVVEVPAYKTLDILKRLLLREHESYYTRLAHPSRCELVPRAPSLYGVETHGRHQHERTPLTSPTPTERVFELSPIDTMSDPHSIRSLQQSHPSTYTAVAIAGGGRSQMALSPFDTQTRAAKHLNAHAHSRGEPIFVPNPQGSNEDDGVLFSVVLDRLKGTSYLLVPNAMTLSGIGRTSMDIPFPFGFHGMHVSGQ